MRPKFQKRSELKLDGRIIPEAKRSGVGPYYREMPNAVFPTTLLFKDISLLFLLQIV
jgi:hypothetical protein